jgi:hypothetical protein
LTAVLVSGASTSAALTATQVDGDADGAVGDATYVSTQFWNFVDDQLKKVQERAELASPTEEGQKKWMDE